MRLRAEGERNPTRTPAGRSWQLSVGCSYLYYRFMTTYVKPYRPDLTPLQNNQAFPRFSTTCRWLQRLHHPRHPGAWTAPTSAKHLYNPHKFHDLRSGDRTSHWVRNPLPLTVRCRQPVFGGIWIEADSIYSVTHGGHANNVWRSPGRRLARKETSPTASRRPTTRRKPGPR